VAVVNGEDRSRAWGEASDTVPLSSWPLEPPMRSRKAGRHRERFPRSVFILQQERGSSRPNCKVQVVAAGRHHGT